MFLHEIRILLIISLQSHPRPLQYSMTYPNLAMLSKERGKEREQENLRKKKVILSICNFQKIYIIFAALIPLAVGDRLMIQPANPSSNESHVSNKKKPNSRGPLDDTPERTKLYRKYIIELKAHGITDEMLSQKM